MKNENIKWDDLIPGNLYSITSGRIGGKIFLYHTDDKHETDTWDSCLLVLPAIVFFIGRFYYMDVGAKVDFLKIYVNNRIWFCDIINSGFKWSIANNQS